MGKPAAPALRHRSSRADHWTVPRPHTDASLRLKNHGPVQSMPAEPADWFTWPMRATMIGATLVVSAFAMGWI